MGVRLKVLLIFIVFPILSYGQLDSVLKSFTAILNEDEIILNWTMYGGYQCNGTDILRSEDGYSFIKIGEIAGICGSPSKDEPYTYTDTIPVMNTTNYYMLHLNFYGDSHIIEREIFDLKSKGYLLFPNPIINTGKIIFSNPKGEFNSLYLYNSSGQYIIQDETKLDYFEIEVSNLTSGLYVFIIKSESGSTIRGKIVIGKSNFY